MAFNDDMSRNPCWVDVILFHEFLAQVGPGARVGRLRGVQSMFVT